MTRVAAFLVARLGLLLVPAWIAAAIAAVHYLPAIEQGGGSPLGGLVPGNAAALHAQQHEVDAFGNSLLTPIVVVQHANKLTTTQLRRTASVAARIDRTRHDPRFPGLRLVAPLVSPNRTTVVTYLYFPASVSESDQLATADRFAHALDPPGLRTGALLARQSEFDQIQRSLPWVTLATVLLIALILAATFRAVVPPLLVLGTAGIAYTIAVRLIARIAEARHQAVPKEVEPVLVALLLGLVTDYAIFFLAGMRRRLAAGASRYAAADETTRENLPIILVAGLIVALGSLSLVAGHLAVFRSFGPGMALAVVVALAVATTFIPGLLALLGPLAFWPSLQRADREPRRRLWHTLTARPVSGVVAVAIVAGLLACCTGLLHLHLGFSLVRGQPPGAEVKRAQEHAQDGFSAGITGPTELLLRSPGIGGHLTAVERLEAAVRREPGVTQVVGPHTRPRIVLPLFVAKNGNSARFVAVLSDEPLDAKAISVLRHLRARMPALLRHAGLQNARVEYAGDTALADETVAAVRGDGVRVGLAVALVNLVLLALFLRAFAAPLYLLVASILAVGASLGVTTFVMQSLLHHDDVTYYVPFAAAVLLLSLGSDYNVFVVGRIWQAAREKPLRDAIADTAPRTSSTITTAGVTLAGSFGMLALIPLRPMRELALAMATGILLDTFVVRSLLVPSLLALFRRREQERHHAALGDGEAPLHE